MRCLCVSSNEKYSGRISGAGSLIRETKIILSELAKGIDMKELEKRAREDNTLDKITLRSREKTYSAIKLRFLVNPKINRTILIKLINSNLDESIKDFILYYYFSKTEKIVYDLTTQFLYKKFQTGDLAVSKKETLAFFEMQRKKHPEIERWTPTTRLRTIEHYLAIMKDFKFLKGSKKKIFDIPFIPLELILYVVYDLFRQGLNAKQIINSEDFKLFLISVDDLVRYLEDASRKGFIKFNHVGNIYEIMPYHKSLEEYVDEIARKV